MVNHLGGAGGMKENLADAKMIERCSLRSQCVDGPAGSLPIGRGSGGNEKALGGCQGLKNENKN